MLNKNKAINQNGWFYKPELVMWPVEFSANLWTFVSKFTKHVTKNEGLQDRGFGLVAKLADWLNYSIIAFNMHKKRYIHIKQKWFKYFYRCHRETLEQCFD